MFIVNPEINTETTRQYHKVDSFPNRAAVRVKQSNGNDSIDPSGTSQKYFEVLFQTPAFSISRKGYNFSPFEDIFSSLHWLPSSRRKHNWETSTS
jgi:hypothetical protein